MAMITIGACLRYASLSNRCNDHIKISGGVMRVRVFPHNQVAIEDYQVYLFSIEDFSHEVSGLNV
jgi:hypothetical protein